MTPFGFHAEVDTPFGPGIVWGRIELAGEGLCYLVHYRQPRSDERATPSGRGHSYDYLSASNLTLRRTSHK